MFLLKKIRNLRNPKIQNLTVLPHLQRKQRKAISQKAKVNTMKLKILIAANKAKKIRKRKKVRRVQIIMNLKMKYIDKIINNFQ